VRTHPPLTRCSTWNVQDPAASPADRACGATPGRATACVRMPDLGEPPLVAAPRAWPRSWELRIGGLHTQIDHALASARTRRALAGPCTGTRATSARTSDIRSAGPPKSRARYSLARKRWLRANVERMLRCRRSPRRPRCDARPRRPCTYTQPVDRPGDDRRLPVDPGRKCDRESRHGHSLGSSPVVPCTARRDVPRGTPGRIERLAAIEAPDLHGRIGRARPTPPRRGSNEKAMCR
jgi:hypothetical protein